jgi:3-oxoacyl-[acyl-carrier-protein] synthase II
MNRGRQRRVAITGIGAVTPIGHGREGLWQGVLRGKSAVRRVSAFDVDAYRCQLAAEVRDFDPTSYLDKKQLKRLDRYSQFAVRGQDGGRRRLPGARAEPHDQVGSVSARLSGA